LANLAGYLPGYGWKYLGKAYLTSQEVPVQVASWAVLIEFVCLAVTRLAITVTFATPKTLASLVPHNTGIIIWIVRIISWTLVITMPVFIQVIMRTSPKRFLNTIHYRLQYLWLAEAVMCLVWIVYGIGYAILVSAIIPIQLNQYPVFIFSTTASYLVSLLVFFIPGGIGVREAVLIATMVNFIPDAVSSTSSVLSRGILIISELLGVFIGLLLKDHHKKDIKKMDV